MYSTSCSKKSLELGAANRARLEEALAPLSGPGVVVHPGAGNHEKTIVNGLLFKYKNKLSSVGRKLRPGIIHRIDKDTSGLILVAKNNIVHENLSNQFNNQ